MNAFPLTELPATPRTLRALQGAGFETVGDIIAVGFFGLARVQGLGSKGRNEVAHLLMEVFGYNLGVFPA